jgi:hypothetical protein
MQKLSPDSSLGGNLEESLHESHLSANVAFPDSFNLSLPTALRTWRLFYLQQSRSVASWLLTANNVIKTGAGLLIGTLIGSLVAALARSRFSEVARPQDSYMMQFMPGDDVSDGAHA